MLPTTHKHHQLLKLVQLGCENGRSLPEAWHAAFAEGAVGHDTCGRPHASCLHRHPQTLLLYTTAFVLPDPMPEGWTAPAARAQLRPLSVPGGPASATSARRPQAGAFCTTLRL